jgi:hypothetical protein
LKTAASALSIVGAVVGFFVGFAVWGIRYCGGLTPDYPSPGTLRHDLCSGTSGDFVNAGTVIAWLLAAVAPLLGGYWARRRGAVWPLVLCTTVGAAPIATIAILAYTLPQN